MPEIIKTCEQGSRDWLNLRCGSIGGTLINSIAPMKDGYKKALYEFVGEMLTGVPVESFKFQHADRGHEHEPDARLLYELKTGYEVEQIAMIKEGGHKHFSPDGLIGDSGILEIKTRVPAQFLRIAEGGLEPIADRRQRQWGFLISGRKWVDSVNYCPEFAAAGLDGMLIKRVTPEEEAMEDLRAAAEKFLGEAYAMADKYKGKAAE